MRTLSRKLHSKNWNVIATIFIQFPAFLFYVAIVLISLISWLDGICKLYKQLTKQWWILLWSSSLSSTSTDAAVNPLLLPLYSMRAITHGNTNEMVYTSAVIPLKCVTIATMPFPNAHSIPGHKSRHSVLVPVMLLLLKNTPSSFQQSYMYHDSNCEVKLNIVCRGYLNFN